MKNLSVWLFAMAFTIVSSVSAYNSTSVVELPSTIAQLVTKEIGKTLANHPIELGNRDEIIANVTFTVNKENEIVVLSVDSNCKDTCQYIKQRLNYHKLPVTGLERDRKYKGTVKLQ